MPSAETRLRVPHFSSTMMMPLWARFPTKLHERDSGAGFTAGGRFTPGIRTAAATGPSPEENGSAAALLPPSAIP